MLKSTPIWTVIYFAALAMAGCGGVSSDSALEDGDRALREYEYGSARKLFELARKQHVSGSEEWIQATYGQALAAWHQFPATKELSEEAKSLQEELLDVESLDTSMRGRVLLNLGRIYEVRDYPGDIEDVAKSREIYESIVNEFADSALGYEAMLRLAGSYEQEIKVESLEKAEAIMSGFLRDSVELGDWTSVSWQRLGDLRFEFLRDYQGALEAYQEAKRRGFVNEVNADRFIWKMAYMAEQTGDYAFARELYTEIVEEYLRSNFQLLSKKRIMEIDAMKQSSVSSPKEEGPSS